MCKIVPNVNPAALGSAARHAHQSHLGWAWFKARVRKGLLESHYGIVGVSVKPSLV